MLTNLLLTIWWIVGFLLASPRSNPVDGAGGDIPGGGEGSVKMEKVPTVLNSVQIMKSV